ncbi:hypothetical protein BpHYR1_012344 [Brachionus plicatilis]|uniref:Uncharacterized protein n=1 Tax=Brachionus plicatilis TaxID=10195 RepID=A0A3M7PU69_BRAPC|nr:hypothetical protein BpHYR1_012344 [Brachionus plicatilis]
MSAFCIVLRRCAIIMVVLPTIWREMDKEKIFFYISSDNNHAVQESDVLILMDKLKYDFYS